MQIEINEKKFVLNDRFTVGQADAAKTALFHVREVYLEKSVEKQGLSADFNPDFDDLFNELVSSGKTADLMCAVLTEIGTVWSTETAEANRLDLENISYEDTYEVVVGFFASCLKSMPRMRLLYPKRLIQALVALSVAENSSVSSSS